MRRIVLDGYRLTDCESAQDYLAQMLDAPEYYGKNLDALADCLGELGEDTEIVLLHAAGCTLYGERVRRVLRDMSLPDGSYTYTEM